jgi:hypothetical protein
MDDNTGALCDSCAAVPVACMHSLPPTSSQYCTTMFGHCTACSKQGTQLHGRSQFKQHKRRCNFCALATTSDPQAADTLLCWLKPGQISQYTRCQGHSPMADSSLHGMRHQPHHTRIHVCSHGQSQSLRVQPQWGPHQCWRATPAHLRVATLTYLHGSAKQSAHYRANRLKGHTFTHRALPPGTEAVTGPTAPSIWSP